MMRITSLPYAAAAVALTATACGSSQPNASDQTIPPADTPTTDSVPSVTLTPNAADPLPVDPSPDAAAPGDDVVLELSITGGFMMRKAAFKQTPAVLITADGTVYFPGITTDEYPGSFLDPTFTISIDDPALADVLAAADAAGMLTDVDYSQDSLIADAPTTVLAVRDDADVYVHSADALGINSGGPGQDAGEQSSERAALSGFINDVAPLTGIFDAPPVAFVPDSFDMIAFEVADPDTFAGDGLDATVVEWPAGAEVTLRDALVGSSAAACVTVDATAVRDVFGAADELTLFSHDSSVFQVVVRPTLPGFDCTTGHWYE